MGMHPKLGVDTKQNAFLHATAAGPRGRYNNS